MDRVYNSVHRTSYRLKAVKKPKESEVITSFHLSSMDQSILLLEPYYPGQHLTLRVWVEDLACFQEFWLKIAQEVKINAKKGTIVFRTHLPRTIVVSQSSTLQSTHEVLSISKILSKRETAFC
jgi:aminoglycoside/choline kinase family phosphotransferase